MANETKTYRFGDEEITVDAALTVEQVRDIWAAVHPALVNAEVLNEEDGSHTFLVRGGSKG